eukprot:CAMPEP_0168546348 /NCGR_PEP_ID=MMETSP0413-20121227/3452_1 /TAXON_ID=136452 /ORGANISM="Filamoeba nolandi, Strain NC-AS-23-1" /LENGTH=618 /DNA_ID=CAMNT_0008576523 /DNA_START=103 /DNA_END=1959 /DNA_ORIENTATION=-
MTEESRLQVNKNPIELVIEDLHLSIDLRHQYMPWKITGTKEILKGINGIASPGKVLAILGGSGSGKTTFLNTLAGRMKESHMKGSISINGQRYDTTDNKLHSKLLSLGAYVTQDDYLLPNLTVRETLTFAAQLKLPSTMSSQQKKQRVETIITELRLTACAETIIGNQFVRGISGGEKRRVSIGVQLLTNPSVLYLDEPTSGLDSTTAHNLMQTLLYLAHTYQTTIVCTLHQPRSDIFDMFDDVMLLSNGYVAYFGEAKMVKFFAKVGYEFPIYANPADIAMDLVTVDTKNEKTQAASSTRLEQIVDGYKEYAEKKQMTPQEQKSDESIVHNTSNNMSMLDLSVTSNERPSALQQFTVLYTRALRNILRDKLAFFSKLIYSVVLAVLLGGICYDLGHDQVGYRDRYGFISLVLGLTPFMAIISSCLVQWHFERIVFTRERQDNLYDLGPFFAAKLVSEVPFDILFNVLYSSIIYWMTNLNNGLDRFFMFIFLVHLLIYWTQSMGYAFGALIPHLPSATTAANAIFTVFVLVDGWVVNYDDIPIVFKWVKYISPLAYGYEALVINEFKGEDFYCTEEQAAQSFGYCPVETGEDVIQQLSMEHATISRSIGVIICSICGV